MAVGVGALLAPVASASAAEAIELVPAQFGPELTLNTTTDGDQYFASAATNRQGVRLVAWTDTSALAPHDHDHDHGHSHDETPADDHEDEDALNRTAVRARLVDASGAPSGPEIVVDTTRAGNQNYPAVTSTDDGGFVVAYLHQVGAGAQELRAVRVAATGAVGQPLVLSQQTSPVEFAPAIASLPGNGFVVAWTGAGADAPGMWDVKARTIDGANRPVGTEHTLNRTTSERQSRPSLTRTATGFAAAWIDASKQVDTDGSGIRGAVFDAAGTPLAEEQQLNTEFAGFQQRPSLTTLTDGRVAAAWEDGSSARDGSGSAVVFRMMNPNLTSGNTEQVLPTTITGNQQKPKLTAVDGGGFVAIWEDASKSPDDPIYLAVRARAVQADGSLVGKDSLVNVSTDNNQQQPVVTGAPGHAPFAIWTDASGAGSDTDDNAVRGRVLALTQPSQPVDPTDPEPNGPEPTDPEPTDPAPTDPPVSPSNAPTGTSTPPGTPKHTPSVTPMPLPSASSSIPTDPSQAPVDPPRGLPKTGR